MTDRQTILLVNDDDLVMDFYARLLDTTELDYVCAPGGEEALALLAARTFDLVITDLSMPGVSGLELLAALQREHPQTRRILITGSFTNHDELAHIRESGLAHRVLLKPCRIADFLAAITEELAAGSGAAGSASA